MANYITKNLAEAVNLDRIKVQFRYLASYFAESLAAGENSAEEGVEVFHRVVPNEYDAEIEDYLFQTAVSGIITRLGSVPQLPEYAGETLLKTAENILARLMLREWLRLRGGEVYYEKFLKWDNFDISEADSFFASYTGGRIASPRKFPPL